MAQLIDGGEGDDDITLSVTEHASLLFERGDGNDRVSISGSTHLVFAGRAAEDAIITRGDGTITISFRDSDDTVTIDYSNAQLSGDEPSLNVTGAKTTADIHNTKMYDFDAWSFDTIGYDPGGFQIRIF